MVLLAVAKLGEIHIQAEVVHPSAQGSLIGSSIDEEADDEFRTSGTGIYFYRAPVLLYDP